MNCFKCGKTIDDETKICPKCGEMTEKGILTLIEAAKQGASTHDNRIFTTIKPKGNTNTLRHIAMILGLVGCMVMLGSLLMDCYSFMVPIDGNTTISMYKYLDVRTMVILNLIEMSLVFSLWRFAVPQIMAGSSVALWTGYMFWKIQLMASNPEYLNVHFGLGLYMLILSAVLIIASGIVFVIDANKSKSLGIDDEKPRILKKTEFLISVMFGLGIAFCSVFEILVNRHG